MSTLVELQREFQRFVLGGAAAIAQSVNATERVPVATRLSIYADAYRSRLAEALASNAPRLRELLGNAAFDEIARCYVEEHPSSFASIRWFGEKLAASLERSHPSQPWLAELARWEWAIAAAFDAADAAPMSIERLAGVAPDDWPGLTLQFHPSIQRLDLRTNAAALFKAFGDEQPGPEPAQLDRAQHWIIWRRDLKTQYRSTSSDEAAAIDAMRAGGDFAAMCELLGDWHDSANVPAAAAGMLKRWIVDELVIGRVTAADA